jgi:hypothetical protein
MQRDKAWERLYGPQGSETVTLEQHGLHVLSQRREAKYKRDMRYIDECVTQLISRGVPRTSLRYVLRDTNHELSSNTGEIFHRRENMEKALARQLSLTSATKYEEPFSVSYVVDARTWMRPVLVQEAEEAVFCNGGCCKSDSATVLALQKLLDACKKYKLDNLDELAAVFGQVPLVPPPGYPTLDRWFKPRA